MVYLSEQVSDSPSYARASMLGQVSLIGILSHLLSELLRIVSESDRNKKKNGNNNVFYSKNNHKPKIDFPCLNIVFPYVICNSNRAEFGIKCGWKSSWILKPCENSFLLYFYWRRPDENMLKRRCLDCRDRTPIWTWVRSDDLSQTPGRSIRTRGGH